MTHATSASSPSVLTSFVRWLRLKNYQYEVTFALYMLTPTEKFIFNSLVISLLTLLITAAYVYLPNHVASIYGHLVYYLTADVSMIQDYIPSANSVLKGAASSSTGGNLNVVYDTVKAPVATALHEL
ncbi:hypothetical protein BGW36DRAFT_428980 [Talaromyces proteolyticus]|uniref:Small subunit of serine palmitoyltransferase-like protein n=1 Tax=Talaromyces proteolyticus TaxID=1131652 RepID=A0AAD4KML5_9EURO|nr:uncharacterized protein BGW36DRAFT_428980 [Talaromyces proteolyticus]KAH8695092.1 hypothetical protein BGW36DRAFT_428980 [Talaromyces proteolyticus]